MNNLKWNIYIPLKLFFLIASGFISSLSFAQVGDFSWIDVGAGWNVLPVECLFSNTIGSQYATYVLIFFSLLQIIILIWALKVIQRIISNSGNGELIKRRIIIMQGTVVLIAIFSWLVNVFKYIFIFFESYIQDTNYIILRQLRSTMGVESGVYQLYHLVFSFVFSYIILFLILLQPVLWSVLIWNIKRIPCLVESVEKRNKIGYIVISLIIASSLAYIFINYINANTCHNFIRI